MHAAVWAGLGGSAVGMQLNLVTLRVLSRMAPGRWREPGMVSILVPARNEARNIRACVESLLGQDYPRWEILVLNDHSTDDTAGELERIGGDSRLRVLEGSALPEGWTGKNWACHQLAEAACGEYLFFTDADTVHGAGMVGALVGEMERSGSGLVSAWPRLETGSWAERLVVPLLPFAALVWYPGWVLEGLRGASWVGRVPKEWLRGLGAANGQVMFFKRSVYWGIGGHAGVRGHLVEDVALGRAVAGRMGEGLFLVNCDAGELSRCRMYRTFSEVWEGFSKNARPVFEGAAGGFFAMGTVHFAAYLLPFFLAWGGGWSGVLGCWEVGLVYLLRAAAALRFGNSWLGVVLHPVGYGLGLLIGLNSWVWSWRGRLRWKGRVYRESRFRES